MCPICVCLCVCAWEREEKSEQTADDCTALKEVYPINKSIDHYVMISVDIVETNKSTKYIDMQSVNEKPLMQFLPSFAIGLLRTLISQWLDFRYIVQP